MIVKRPHYLLLSDARTKAASDGPRGGRWHFVLESTADGQKLDVTEREPDISGERLELLSVVRGLEALDQPSCVTLVTPSRYVARGIRFGLEDWRRNDWCWERDGGYAPVKNSDLWQRLDRALAYHQLRFRWLRVDTPHLAASPPGMTPEVGCAATADPLRQLEASSPPSLRTLHPAGTGRLVGALKFVRSLFRSLVDVWEAVRGSTRAATNRWGLHLLHGQTGREGPGWRAHRPRLVRPIHC